MTTIRSTTILRSSNESASDKVLSTLLLRYPRWIHAEQRTHRIVPLCEEEDIFWSPSTPSLMADPNLSRNAASSRAIPVAKLIADVESDPAVPLFWGKNVAGMQATEELPKHLIVKAKDRWMRALENALASARELAYLDNDELGAVVGAHKQIVNRLLEPFSHITVLVSATEWENFLELRDHPDAEPHIGMLAREVRSCLSDRSAIQALQPGQWHLPFIKPADKLAVNSWVAQHQPQVPDPWTEILLRMSVARCASTSYKTVDGFDMTIDKAVSLHDKLVGSRPIHASPAEHTARADNLLAGAWMNDRLHGNFVGFAQYRRMLEAA